MRHGECKFCYQTGKIDSDGHCHMCADAHEIKSLRTQLAERDAEIGWIRAAVEDIRKDARDGAGFRSIQVSASFLLARIDKVVPSETKEDTDDQES